MSGGKTDIMSIPLNLWERLLEITEEIRPTWQRECYEFWETQPKFCASLRLDGEGRLSEESVENFPFSVGLLSHPEEEADGGKACSPGPTGAADCRIAVAGL
jgi:hypothetical protein